ncbi:MAG: DUF6240 domain-containing protein [Wujia sp.]
MKQVDERTEYQVATQYGTYQNQMIHNSIGQNDMQDTEHGYAVKSTGMDVEDVLGYRYAGGTEDRHTGRSVMENFEEYMKARQERARETGEDAQSRERQAKEEAKELARNLSGEEMRQLAMMGIDIENVSFSDIRGIVNTMRGNAHREETARMLAEISASDGDTDDLTIMGGTVRLQGTDIELENVDVSDIITEDDGENFVVGENEFLYLVKNNLSTTRENIYKAHFSGGLAAGKGITDKEFADMWAQIGKVIDQAGYQADDTSLAGARLLLDNDLPVTTDTIRGYMDFQEISGRDISEIQLPDSDEEIYAVRAQQLYDMVQSVRPATIYDMTVKGKELTIASAYMYQKQAAERGEYPDRVEQEAEAPVILEGTDGSDSLNLRAVTNMRQMEEIRLRMTLSAAGRLAGTDINIDTRELSRVVNELRNMEQQFVKEQLLREGVEPSDKNISLYHEMTEKVQTLGDASASVLATPLRTGLFTIDALQQETQYGASSFERVRRSYEAVGTTPRADMGDSISKAFSNVDDILREMDMPVNYETQRAVRILGYNSMDITPQNIEQVVYYDRQVNDLMDSFYPEAVLSMIKDGVNPLDVPIDELNRVIRDRNYNEGVTEAENFATYLRNMEQQGAVSPAERESYIGIYRVMNKLAKSGDREAGYLFANGSRLTIRNLITAMRSRRAAGMDVTMDESFGVLESAETAGRRMDEQIDSAFRNTGNEEKTMEIPDESAERFMEDMGVTATAVNVRAVNAILSPDGGLYQMVSQILSKLHFSADEKDQMLDEVTEDIKDSLMGEDIPELFTPEHILESLKGSDAMSLTYDDMREQLTEMMYHAGVAGNITGMDIASIKTVQAGFNILRGMAGHDRYQIPVRTGQGIRIVNLTIRHDSDQSGMIQIDTKGEASGSVHAEIMMDDDGGLSGYIVAEESDGNYLLMERKDIFVEKLRESGYTKCDISMGRKLSAGMTADHKKAGIYSGQADGIYRATVALVQSVADILE